MYCRWQRLRATVLWVSLMLSLPVTVFADWDPIDGHKMHFPQLPDESGWAVKCEYPNMLADDWRCSESGFVKDIHFWGAWKGGIQGSIKAFHIVIFDDIPVSPTNLFSRPGKVLKRIISTNFIVRSIQPTTMEGWYDPTTQVFSANDHLEYFQYNIFLRPDQWFTQEQDKIYWVGISAELVQGPVLSEWGWKSTKDHFNDDAVWGSIPSGGTSCDVPDNGNGTAAQPAMCAYTSPDEVMRIIDGLPGGTTIEIETELVMLSLTSENPGGSLGGTHSVSEMELKMHMTGTGALAGLARDIVIPLSGLETDQAPRAPGTSPQSFPTSLEKLSGQVINPGSGDPDFDLLRITGGGGYGLPSPGHTTLTQNSGGGWQVESFFDITYRIDFVGRAGGSLGGMSGSTTGTIRLNQGAASTGWTEMYEPQVILPPINNSFGVQIDPNGQFAGGGGSDAYGLGWYTYPSQWINIWFYDHPYDDKRYKKIHIEFDLAPFVPGMPSLIEIAVNWSTDQWSLNGNPPGDRRPPLPGEDEDLYIGRATLFTGTDPSGHWSYDFEIPDYNPEWVSIDVRGRNFMIPGGVIIHECLPKNPPPSLDLAFVITNTGGAFGACCDPATGFCSILTAIECQTKGGTYQGDGTSCTPNPCPPPIGACCISEGMPGQPNCLVISRVECESIFGGAYLGDGTSCGPPYPCDCCGTDGTQIRGNANMLGGVNVVDVTFLVDYLFRGGPTPPCKEEADVNGNGSINVVDLTSLVQYLFNNGPLPALCP